MKLRARLIIKNYELESRRILLGYTQKEFADILGISVGLYSDLELIKKKPNEELAHMIALELETSVDILFPEGYKTLVEVFKKKYNSIQDYTPPLLQTSDHFLLIEQTDTKVTLNKIMSILTDKEKNIVELRNGINDKIPRTLEEIGKSLGVTRERVRQMEERAYEKMAKYKKKLNIEVV